MKCNIIALSLLCIGFCACDKDDNNNSNNFATGIVELPALRAIAFWMEHTDSKPSKTFKLVDYALPIDELEEKTEIDFFPSLNDKLENAIEATYSAKAWSGLE